MLRDQLLLIERELNTRYIDMEQPIHGLLLATLAEQHLLFIGPPGGAKSQLIEDFSQYLGSKPFFRLMTRNTTPDEIFGPLDIQGMAGSATQQSIYRRITKGKLPEAQFAVLDEIFKAGSPILNGLLRILMERKYENDGQELSVPLIFCVGASNELPAEEDGLQAILDRFLLRYHIRNFESGIAIEQMLQLKGKPRPHSCKIQVADIKVAQAEIAKMARTTEAVESIKTLHGALTAAGIIGSNRRWSQLDTVMACESWLKGEKEISPESLEVAGHIFWTQVKDINKVQMAVAKSGNPLKAYCDDLLIRLREAVKDLPREGLAETKDIIELINQCRDFQTTLAGKRQVPVILQTKLKVKQTQDELMTRIQGKG
jgi:MoxR-like ATPase